MWADGRSARRHRARVRRDFEAVHRELSARLDWLDKRTISLERVREIHTRNIEELKDLAGIEALSRWIRHAPLRSRPPISVVLPTHKRPQLLAQAIRSVVDQRYDNWELLVVADGNPDEPREVVRAADDRRIRFFELSRTGPGAARNKALEVARGELIAYLDDDNYMDSEWLYAVAWRCAATTPPT